MVSHAGTYFDSCLKLILLFATGVDNLLEGSRSER